MLADCHTHLDSYSDREVAEVLARALCAGVGFVIAAGTTVASSERAAALSKRFPEVFSGIGIHPMELEGFVDDAAVARLMRLAASTGKVLVVSEIGLDFMGGMPDRAMQYQAFREQVRIALDLRLSIVFHSRESHAEALRVLREERAYEVGGAMHYFQADLNTARQAIDLGFHISLARPLLRLPRLQDVASQLPLSSIVLETDAAPQPFKAKRENWTEPRHLKDVARKLAEIKGVSLEEVEAVTTANLLGMVSRVTVEKYVHIDHSDYGNVAGPT